MRTLEHPFSLASSRLRTELRPESRSTRSQRGGERLVMRRGQRNKIRAELSRKLAEIRANPAPSELIAEPAPDPMDHLRTQLDLAVALHNIDSDWSTAKEVEAALALVESGEYGTCLECGTPINPKRLEAIPWTIRCVLCQESREMTEAEGQHAVSGTK